MEQEKIIFGTRQIFASNLKKLLKDNQLTQSRLSSQIGYSVTSINNYLNEVNDPPISFLLVLKKHFSIQIDDFLTKPVDDISIKKQKYLSVSSEKYIGNYMLYFHESSAYKGAGFNPVKDPIKYGVLSVFPINEQSMDNYKMISMATFFVSRQEAKEFKEKLDTFAANYAEIERTHSALEQKYMGTLESTSTQVFIDLKSNYYNDRVLVILNNPPTEKSYVGGIGTVNSVSRGREPSPVIQYIILSRYFVDMPDGEIYNMLSLSVENIDVRNETMKLLEQFKGLYVEGNTNLEEYQKNYIIQNNIEKSIIDVVKRNIFRYGKISNREDDKYYRLIMSYKKQ